jgi:hypothetical protein
MDRPTRALDKSVLERTDMAAAVERAYRLSRSGGEVRIGGRWLLLAILLSSFGLFKLQLEESCEFRELWQTDSGNSGRVSATGQVRHPGMTLDFNHDYCGGRGRLCGECSRKNKNREQKEQAEDHKSAAATTTRLVVIHR